MNKTLLKPEKGQAMVLLVLGIVALLGFTALAIDGGMVYAERRHAQNAADTAALAAALALHKGGDWSAAGFERAASNSYDDNGTTNDVVVNYPPSNGIYAGNNQYVQVIITSTVPTALIHFVYSGPVRNTVEAIARATPKVISPMFFGNALVGLKPNGEAVMKSHGDPATYIYGSGIFVNSSDSDKAFWQTGGGALYLENGFHVNVVGGATTSAGVYPADAIATGASQISYPPNINIPVPTCTYTVSNLPSVMEENSVYCVTSDLSINGGTTIGHNVLIYMINGNDISFNGNATIQLDAMEIEPYRGLLIYVNPRNYAGVSLAENGKGNCTISINGTSDSTFEGTIYAPSCDISLEGTGNSTGFDSQLIGYTVDMGGTNDLYIHFNPEKQYKVVDPPTIEIAQ